MSTPETPLPAYCFLAGTGRSGTTVLRNSLGQHPEIYYNGKENNIVQDVIDVARHNFVAPSRKFALVVDQPTYCSAFRELLHQILWPDIQQRTRRVWMAAINPNPETLEFLQSVFPEAKVIGLIRDGVDVVLSRQNHRSFKSGTFETHCRTWIRTQPVIEWGQNNAEHFRLFRYKSFSDREQLANRFAELFDWLRISQNDAPLEHALEKTYHPTELENAELESADTESTAQAKRDQWRAWSQVEQDTFKSICGSFMKQMGFEIPF